MVVLVLLFVLGIYCRVIWFVVWYINLVVFVFDLGMIYWGCNWWIRLWLCLLSRLMKCRNLDFEFSVILICSCDWCLLILFLEIWFVEIGCVESSFYFELFVLIMFVVKILFDWRCFVLCVVFLSFFEFYWYSIFCVVSIDCGSGIY